MSIHGSQTARWLKRSLLLAAVALAVSACGTKRDNPEGLDPNFLSAVADAQEAGLTVYWVGEQFEVEGLTFRATGGRFEEREEGSSVEVYYGADSEGGGGVAFTPITYGPRAWESARNRVIPNTEGVIRQAVVVRGWPAELFSIPVGQWTNRLVIVEAPDAVIVARANTTIARIRRQVNPLVDPDQLLAVLENLRPYPE